MSNFSSDLIQQIKERFELRCLKCGSTNVNGYVERGINYGGQTGYQEGTFSLGCNDCKQNDLIQDI